MDALMEQQIRNMEEKDLRDLNRYVVSCLNQKIKMRQIGLAGKFSIGDAVNWMHGGYLHHGKIYKCNQKTASVRETDAKLTGWNISWSCLTKE